MYRLILSCSMALGALVALAQTNGTSLAPGPFGKLMKKNHVLVVDVRTPQEYAQGHLEGAANIDWQGGSLLKDLSGIDRSAPVLLYCGSGQRSGEVKEALVQAGFPHVYDLQGGLEAWAQDGKPVITQ